MSSTTEGGGFFESSLHAVRIALLTLMFGIAQGFLIAFRYLLAGGYQDPQWEIFIPLPTPPHLFGTLAERMGEALSIGSLLRQDLPPEIVDHVIPVAILLTGLVLLPAAFVLLLRARRRVLEAGPDATAGGWIALGIAATVWGGAIIFAGGTVTAIDTYRRISFVQSMHRAMDESFDLRSRCDEAADRAQFALLGGENETDAMARDLQREADPGIWYRAAGRDTIDVGLVHNQPGVADAYENIDGRRGLVEVRMRVTRRGTDLLMVNPSPPR